MNVENISENDSIKNKVRIGRHYIYKGHEYVVDGLPIMKIEENGVSKWVNSVCYSYVPSDNDILRKIYQRVRELHDFVKYFVPIELEVGDVVEVVSMDRCKGFLTVAEINPKDDFIYPVKFDNSNVCAKIKFDFITCKLEVINPDQASEYFFAKPKLDDIDPINYIDFIKDRMDFYNKLLKDVNSNIASQVNAREKISKINKILRS